MNATSNGGLPPRAAAIMLGICSVLLACCTFAPNDAVEEAAGPASSELGSDPSSTSSEGGDQQTLSTVTDDRAESSLLATTEPTTTTTEPTTTTTTEPTTTTTTEPTTTTTTEPTTTTTTTTEPTTTTTTEPTTTTELRPHVGPIVEEEFENGRWGFRAPDADRCAESLWSLSGPVSGTQGKRPWESGTSDTRDGCFTLMHETFTDEMTQPAELPEGTYIISLRLETQTGVRSDISSLTFVVD